MKITFIWLCRIFIGLVAAMLLFQSFLWAFAPDANMNQYGISTNSLLGLNMVKTDIGAGLFAAAIFAILFLYKGKQWFLPTLIIASGYLVIRTISIIMDGYEPTALFGIGLEAVYILAVLTLNKLLGTPKEN